MTDQEIAECITTQFTAILTTNKADLEFLRREITDHINERGDLLNKDYEKYTDKVKAFNKELDEKHEKQWEYAEAANQSRHEDLKLHITQNNRLIAMAVLLNTTGNVDIAKSYLNQIEKVL